MDPIGKTMGEGAGDNNNVAGKAGAGRSETGDGQSAEGDERRNRLKALMHFSKPPPRTPDAGVQAAPVAEEAVGQEVGDEGEGRRRSWKLRERELKEREARAKGEVKRLRHEGDALVRECRCAPRTLTPSPTLSPSRTPSPAAQRGGTVGVASLIRVLHARIPEANRIGREHVVTHVGGTVGSEYRATQHFVA